MTTKDVVYLQWVMVHCCCSGCPVVMWSWHRTVATCVSGTTSTLPNVSPCFPSKFVLQQFLCWICVC